MTTSGAGPASTGRPADPPAKRPTNRLAGETSPYLLQHAHNPVDWYPWGPEALARAMDEGKPIFLSIGYAACHWCHVMERESFEDEATAEDLRRDFVAIKVDREERPDLDQVYMAAVQAMTGGGGWPMNVFLTPSGRPFYGGTYFPNEARHGLPSFRQVLAAVAKGWREDRAAVEASGERLVATLVDQSRSSGAGAASPAHGAEPTAALLDAAVAALDGSFDPRHGGWGRAPKFPGAATIEFLLRRSVGRDGRVTAEADPRALAMARRTLDAMAAGGIHDQLGAGFHRYSTDGAWLVPHFEQMLYDNAQLARVYLHAWQLTGERLYADVAAGTLDYIARELTTADGAFAASQDADTSGEEGATFVWTAAEVRAALAAQDPDRAVAGASAGAGSSAPGSPAPGPAPSATELAALFASAYDVTDNGNWEGRTILRRVRSDEELGQAYGLAAADVGRRLEGARTILFRRRQQRAQPARDDKVLAAWNGLAIAAFAEAAAAFEAAGDSEPGRVERGSAYRAVAERAADAVLRGLRTVDGRLGRSWKDGRATGSGVLEDYTHLADGLLALYEATFDERWFVAARELLDVVLARFADPGGGFFDTADDHEALVTRPKDVQDNALPSGNAMAATVLLRLAALTGDARYETAAGQAMRQVVSFVGRYPTGFGQWLVAMDLWLRSSTEVAIVGDPASDGTKALIGVIREGFRPHIALAVGADPGGSTVPLLEGRFALGGRPTAFVCHDFACRQPVDQPEALAALIQDDAGPGRTPFAG